MLIRQRLKGAEKTLASETSHRVVVQPRTLTGNGATGFVESFTDTPPVWAGVRPLQAWQVTKYASLGVDATHNIRFRGAVAVKETDRIKFGARLFEVVTVTDIAERGVEKLAVCKERR